MTNPMDLQTVARCKDGDYLYHLAQFKDLEKSIACAREWANAPKHSRKGYFAQVTDSKGQLLFDSRS